MNHLLDVLRRLRAPDGCPWDQEQTHASLRPYLLEEAAETVDAISEEDWDELPGELGDVLLQVAFHSVIAEEAGTFDYAQVEQSIVQKLIRRHPHIFGDVVVSGSEEVVQNWQAIKAQERGGKPRSAAERVPAALGALAREMQAQKIADSPAQERADLEQTILRATPDEHGVAEVLAAAVGWARSLGIDPELALRAHTGRTLNALSVTPDSTENV
ncbi:MazG family protein [Deinococcus ruber]|uniref:Nucleoside triphosphate pyrophosphohydrolase n=1 Tax=Deinococcus ruber TaxID=1848197 RepID=A0A918CKP3_9DEIO|nr:MazG family protein [Deinococcus ruber]GGR29615.1 nucleoside triphosphate pyrophosphohydrolase [Deinococcus ruber]